MNRLGLLLCIVGRHDMSVTSTRIFGGTPTVTPLPFGVTWTTYPILHVVACSRCRHEVASG